MILFDGELVSVKDLFENDLIVLMEATIKLEHFDMVKISAGIKDEAGDIVRIVDICERNI